MSSYSLSDTNVTIRPRDDSDIPAAAAGLVKVYASDGYPVEGVGQPENWLTPAGMIMSWVAEISGTVVGHVTLAHPTGEGAVSTWLAFAQENEEKIAVLARLFVVPEARMKAVGEKLMRAAVDYGTRHGFRLVLDVMAKDAAAIRLYQRMGWVQIGVTAHTYGDGEQIEALCFVAPPSD